MSKYKVGDKVILTVTGMTEMGTGYSFYMLNDNFNLWEQSIDNHAEPLSNYTEPLEDKIRRQAAEITRLLAENKELKNKEQKLTRERNQLMGRCGGLSAARIKKFNDGRLAGQNEAWELARKITCQPINGGFNRSEFEEIFGCGYISDIFEKYTYQEAAAKVEAWEKAKEEIKVGDIFQDNDGNNAIVTSIKGNTVYYMWDDGDTRSGFAEDVKKHFTKTGRHIDIDSFLKQIGEE